MRLPDVVPLAAMRRFQAPNVLIFSRSPHPNIPGFLVDESEEIDRSSPQVGGGKKRPQVGFSKRSSLNLVRLLSILDWAKNGHCIHVSLTYGRSGFPGCKSALLSEKSKLAVYLGTVAGFCGIWRLEYQARESQGERSARIAAGKKRTKEQGGSCYVPHWHFLLWVGDRDLAQTEVWIRSWWKAFSGNSSFYGCKITTGNSRGAWYLSLHAGKKNQSPNFAVGRWWGYINKAKVLASTDVHCTGESNERELVWVARLYRRSTGARTRNAKGFTWFLPRRWQGEVFAWIRSQIVSERLLRATAKNPF